MTRTTRRLPKLPQTLPTRRGEKRRASYDETRAWLWKRLQAGDRGIANALWFFGRHAPAGVIDLPKTLDDVACEAAARWVRTNPARVAVFVALANKGGR